MFIVAAALPRASAEGSPGTPARTWRPSPPTFAQPECSLCHGTGWQLVSGAARPGARRCSCRTLRRVLQIREEAGVPTRYESCTLDGFVPATDSQARAVRDARRFVERYPEVSRGLLLVGPPGSGKTHLAVGILRELLDRFEDDLLFCDFPTLFRSGLAFAGSPSRSAFAGLRSGFGVAGAHCGSAGSGHAGSPLSEPAPTSAFGAARPGFGLAEEAAGAGVQPGALAAPEREPGARLAGAALLVIDDFGGENLGEQWRAFMASLVARRMRAGLPTIVTARSLREDGNAHDCERGRRARAGRDALESLLLRFRRVSMWTDGGCEKPVARASLF